MGEHCDYRRGEHGGNDVPGVLDRDRELVEQNVAQQAAAEAGENAERDDAGDVELGSHRYQRTAQCRCRYRRKVEPERCLDGIGDHAREN